MPGGSRGIARQAREQLRRRTGLGASSMMAGAVLTSGDPAEVDMTERQPALSRTELKLMNSA